MSLISNGYLKTLNKEWKLFPILQIYKEMRNKFFKLLKKFRNPFDDNKLILNIFRLSLFFFCLYKVKI